MKNLSERIAHLTPEQRKLLEKRRKKIEDSQPSKQAIPRREGDGPWPTSMDQTALWFFHQMDPETTVYNIFGANYLDGPVDVGVMQQAVTALAQRHEILRTTFTAIEGQPYQVVAPKANIKLTFFDIRHLPAAERDTAAKKLVSRQNMIPFDLERGPMFRPILVQLEDERFVMAFCVHHIVIDWWSFQLLERESVAFYEAILRDSEPDLPLLPIQYADYAVWRNQWRQSPDYEKQLQFWLKQLEGAPMVVDFVGDNPRPPIQSFSGKRMYFDLAEGVSEGIRRLNLAVNASAMTTLVATAFVFLYRMTGQRDILIGTGNADRERPETLRMVGYLLNVLLLRGHMTDDPTFMEFLGRCRNSLLSGFENKDFPFRNLVERLNPERDLSRMPIYQVEFNHVFGPGKAVKELAGQETSFAVTGVVIDRGVSPPDLQINFVEKPDIFELCLEFNTDLWRPATMQRMGELYADLMESIVAHPNLRLSQIPWLKPEGQARMLAFARANKAPAPEYQTIHATFERFAADTPQAIALSLPGRALSYAEMNARANRLAHYLLSQGVGPDQPVALRLKNSPELLIGILAILKAGGAYMPLDPSLPSARTAFMLADTGAQLLLSHSDLDPIEAPRAFFFDRDSDALEGFPQTDPKLAHHPDQIAYIIYTSGSTGQPKGVQVTHANVASLVFDTHALGFEPETGMGQVSTPAFDAFTLEVWTTFLRGGRLCLIDGETLGNPDALQDYIQSQKLDALFLTTALFNQLARDRADIFTGLKHLAFGGERVDGDAVRAVLHTAHAPRLYNLYGPAEACVYSAAHKFGQDLLPDVFWVPIGKPTASNQVYVLDRHLSPSPIGIIAEICLGGDGLARGYLNRPDLTAIAFIPNPFAEEHEAGSRLYRTGDQGRFLADGTLEFHGRRDNQIKLRGYRIETGEIEAVIAELAGIREVVVLLREDRPGDRKLVAYLVPDSQSAGKVDVAAAAREFVRERLPVYMLPSAFVLLERLPLTANGKIDRRALPKPELVVETRQFEAPADEVERALAEIWQEVLGVDAVGGTDNFFALGGDSILSIQVISRAKKHGLNLTPKLMFTTQNVRELAAKARANRAVIAEQGAISGVVPLSPIQHWFFKRQSPVPNHFNFSFMLQAQRPLEEELLMGALVRLCRHHDVLRMRFQQRAGVWNAEITTPAEGPHYALERVAITDPAQAKAPIEAVALRAQGELDIEKGPLIKVVWYDLGADHPPRLLFVLHHLVADNVSWQVMARDFESLYTTLERRGTPELGDKTTSWRQWVQRLGEHAKSEAMTGQLLFWLAQSSIDPARELARLPLDFSSGDNREASSQLLTTHFSSEETQAILQQVPAVYNTRINDFLLAGLVLAMGEETGCYRLRVAMEGHGREDLFEDVDLSHTAGWFTSMYPVLLEVADPRPAAALVSIKEQMRAIPDNGIGYGLLRYYNPAGVRLLAGDEEPEIGFNYLGRFDQAVAESGLFGFAPESPGPNNAPENPRAHLLDVMGAVMGGQLMITWSFSAEQHRPETIARLAERYQRALRALLDQCLSSKAGGRTPSDFPLANLDQITIDKLTRQFDAVEDIYATTPMQRGLLYQNMSDSQSRTNIEQAGLSLMGVIEPEKLRQAWQTMSDRHPILRTLFIESKGQILQVVLAKWEILWTFEDWTGQEPSGHEARLQDYLAADMKRGFHLTAEPPVRFHLLRLSQSKHRFIWTFHHSLLDGWSIPTLLGEALAVYRASRAGETLTLAPAPAFRDYIAWLEQRDQAAADAFWRTMFAGFDRPNHLPKGSDQEPKITAEAFSEILLPAETTERLVQMARANGITLNTLVMGAWSLLISRYTLSGDVVIGITVSGRPAELAGIEGMVGIFINTLPIRIRVEDRQPLLAFFKDIQALQAEIRQYEFSALTDIAVLAGVPAGQPLFESIFVFENYPSVVASATESEFHIAEPDIVHESGYPLVLAVVPGERLALRLNRGAECFTLAMSESFLPYLRFVLEDMAGKSDRRIGDLRSLPAAQRQQELALWNDTAAQFPGDRTVHQLFAELALEHPDAPALVGESEPFSYAQLEAASNRLANLLCAHGIENGGQVGLCLAQGPETMVALLAILKTGNAYVPLDPAYPAERLAFMAADTGLSTVIVHESLLDQLPPEIRDHHAMLVLDQLRSELAASSAEPPARTVCPESLAYIMFTSGSTGTPKGVAITHRNIIRLVKSNDYTNFAPDRVFIEVAPLPFDASTYEIWGPLLNGACLVVPDSRDIDRIPAWLARAGVNTLHLTSQLFNLAVDEYLDTLADLDEVLTGGETLSVPHAQRFKDRYPDIRLIHCYGPTENTTFSLTHDLQAHGKLTGPAPIGLPIANATAYVLAPNLNPVPLGVEGELLVGGEGLARCYWNRADQTALKFIPNPFANLPGERLYRTGDLARRNANGTIEFIGRADRQVKLRGFRIELGEIETLIKSNERVKDAVVILHDQGDRDARVVAYLTVAEGGAEGGLDLDRLREYLADKLPAFMVPAALIRLDAIPVTANGKLDRKALPHPDQATRPASSGHNAPFTPTEEVLATIWSQVLHIDMPGAHDDFFALGGHSISATQVSSRVREILNLAIALKDFFQYTTLKDLAHFIDRERQASEGLEDLTPVPGLREGYLPLSFSQERLWFLENMRPDAVAYNVPNILRFTGEWNMDAFQKAFREILQLHDVLRTRFGTIGDKPTQIIADSMELPLTIHDLSDLPSGPREEAYRRYTHEETHRPFALDQGPLMRLTLLRLTDDVHHLLLNIHHIISDGWSLQILLGQFATLYHCFVKGEPSPFEKTPLQFADFARWQRQWLHGAGLDRQLAFWERTLKGSPHYLDLPLDFPRPPTQSFKGSHLPINIDERTTAAAAELCASEIVTQFVWLVSAFAILLSRYSRQTDVNIGTTVSNRNRTSFESLMGFFINTLVLRLDLDGDPTFAQVLGRVRKMTMDAYTHQDVPFEQVVERLQPPRDLGRTPLFQAALSFVNLGVDPHAEAVQLPGLVMESEPLDYEISKFDLSMVLARQGNRVTGVIEFDTALFRRETIAAMAGNFDRLLRGLTGRPHEPISSISMLADEDRALLLRDWTATDYPREATVAELFQGIAAVGPSAVALIHDDETRTYGALNAWSNQIAHRLRSGGMAPGALIGLCLAPGFDLIAATLAILKAGGAYLPLDAAYPQGRLAFMIEDSGMTGLITESVLLAQLPVAELSFLDTLVLDEERAFIEAEPEQDLVPDGLGSDRLAYVMYTSGSTGRPKGVAVSQRNIIRLVRETNYVRLDADNVFLQAASISFDAATFEIWGALLNGARLALTESAAVDRLPELLTRHGVTTIFLTTQLFNLMVDEHIECLAGVRELLVGGEALSVRHVRRFLAAYPESRLCNIYGPTEGTTFSSFYDISGEGFQGATVPIGRPIANARLHVVDETLCPQPTGLIGELLIGGDGLAWGYLNRPDLTAERFVPDAFATSPEQAGGRLYRTGDLVRALPGTVLLEAGTSGIGSPAAIEFIGRTDHQVKLRGFRIELGEIEAQLRSHPALADACVIVASDDEAGTDAQLIAYLIEAGGPDGAEPPAVEAAGLTPVEARDPALETGALREFLADKLPAYMLPAQFVFLPYLPLNANGKLDRNALPRPERGMRVGEWQAPASPTEEVLAAIWSAVLGVTRVGGGDNFFELGGHSLLATQVVSRIRDVFATHIALETLFEFPDLRDLAAVIDRARRLSQGVAEPEIVALDAASKARGVALSFAQSRLWFLEKLEPGPAYNMPIALRLTGRLDRELIAPCLDEILRRHEALRTRFSERDGLPVQIVDPPRPAAFRIEDLTATPQSQREAVCRQRLAEEGHTPFSLEDGPLLRVTLYILGEQSHVLLFTMHHIVSDAWSLQIMFTEFVNLYLSMQRGEPSPLPTFEIQYPDFAAWQREWLRGEMLERQLDFWQRQLAGCPPHITLPADFPRPERPSFDGLHHRFELSPELSDAMMRFCREHDLTLFMGMISAYAVLLSRYANQTDLNIGTPIANRNRLQIEHLIGFFVNTLVVRVNLADDAPPAANDGAAFESKPLSFADLVKRVRRTTLDGYAHQDVPFEQIVERIQPVRDTSRSPLYQAGFTMTNIGVDTGETETRLPELTLSVQEMDYYNAKFDLSLFITPMGDRLIANFEYSTDLFRHETITAMARNFVRLLQGLTARPHEPLAAISMLADEDRALLLRDWTASAYPRESTVAELFQGNAAARPNAVALIHDDETLTYAELNVWSNQIAHRLRSGGMARGALIGLCLTPGFDLIAATLAILKAGGAYLPLDSGYPQGRLAFMIEDSGMTGLITEAALLDRLPVAELNFLDTLVLDEERAFLEAESEQDPDPDNLGPDRLAYVMYTSGSTGRPKGVAVSQRNIVRLVRETGYAHFDADEVFLQAASIGFDAATFEIWGALLNGARLVLTESAAVDRLPELLTRHGVTTLWLTAQLFNLMVDEHLDSLAGVRQLLAGGEALSVRHVRRFLAAHPENRLINGYGPTEGTTFTCCFDISGEGFKGVSVPIGRPIANTRVSIVDAALNPQPVGLIGELLIGGDGLAWGYLNRPAMTAERFVPDPFAATPQRAGGRLYRSGDLVRAMPGTAIGAATSPEGGTPEVVTPEAIEFIGRTDHQVKLRGFRIELGEIEAHLKDHPALDDARVILLGGGDAQADAQLIAYLIEHEVFGDVQPPSVAGGALTPIDARDPALEARTLREYLSDKLPTYMLPSQFVFLPYLPLNANGKLDRDALPRPERGARVGEWQAPASPTEEVLAGIWSTVLGVARVGAGDNFFELGGHSLLATQVVSRIRDVFATQVPLEALFEFPDLRDLAAVIDRARRTSQGVAEPEIVALDPAAKARGVALSFAQSRLWFLEKLEPGPAYNMPIALRLTGGLDRERIAPCLDEILVRHEALRTRFAERDGLPFQIVDPPRPAAFRIEDLTATPESEREALCRQRLVEEGHTPFSLEDGPLLRVTLYILGEECHVLLFTMHHIVSDAWSLQILFTEFVNLYLSKQRGEPSPLSDFEIQYPDFAAWQRDWLRDEVLERQLDFWQRQLADGPAHITLPTDYPRPEKPTYAGLHHRFELSRDLTERVTSFCREHDLTLFMGLISAYAVLLGRYAGQNDVQIGTTIANRNRSQIEHLIGFFVNTQVVRVRLGDDVPTATDHQAARVRRPLSFADLVKRVRRTTLDGYAHQDVPFEQIVERVQPVRDTSRSPLFQVMFSMANVGTDTDQTETHLPGLTLGVQPMDYHIAKFDLTLFMGREGDRLIGSFEYSTDLFKAETIAALSGHFTHLLSQLMDHPDEALAEIEMLEAAERQRLLVDWNQTERPFPAQSTLAQWFEQSVSQRPGETALVHGSESLTFAELNARANRLAHLLIGKGVKNEAPVAICLTRTPAIIVAMLAVLKAGGAYVPLDPAYPRERIATTLEDARAGWMITESVLLASLPENAARAICLDREEVTLAVQPETNPGIAVDPMALAYVLFTSGSTGRPKGVAIPHRSVVAMLTWAGATFAPEQRRAVMAATSICFDLSVFEIFLPLTQGGTVVLAENALALPELNHPVTLVNTVPSAISELLDGGRIPSSVTTVNLAGEALRGVTVNRLYGLNHVVEVNNLYGPSEDTTYSTWARIPRSTDREPAIGRPLHNSRVYLLDASMRPVPAGCPGEIYLAGAGLARGYLGQPQQTAARFLPDPFAQRAAAGDGHGIGGERLYRTGDLGRYRSDGDIEFLGRLDHQVKLRGFRIELGEIEALLRAHSFVAETTVLARQAGGEAGRQLVAYVQPRTALAGDEAAVTALTEELRVALQAKLPDFMMPAFFVVLDVMPRTPNGKLDRAALPEPRLKARTYTPPGTATERLLAEIWSGLLGLERVGRDDHFFELGGHSLLATQLRSRLRDGLGREVPLQAVFRNPGLAALASYLDGLAASAGESGSGSEAPVTVAETPLVPQARTARVPLSFAQERMWFLHRLVAQPSAYNMPAVMRVDGILDVGILGRAMTELVRRHESLRTRFPMIEGSPVQEIDAPWAVIPELIDLSGIPADQREISFRADLNVRMMVPFDLEDRLLRVTLYRIGLPDLPAVLLVNQHHLIGDGWSQKVLAGELSALLTAFGKGQASPLPEPQLQYPDFAIWQRTWLAGSVLEAQLGYWETALGGAPDALDLPLDRPRPSVQTYAGGDISFVLPPALGRAVTALCGASGATPYMALLAAFGALLGRYSGQRDLLIGSPIANRNRTEVEGLIGLFVNTLVMRIDLSGAPGYRALLARVAETCLGAFAHQDVPFEQVVERVTHTRNLSRTPLFQVLFTLDRGADDALATGAAPVPGETATQPLLSPFNFEYAVAKFDLSLHMLQRGEHFEGTFNFNTDLFDAATVAGIARHFSVLLEAMCGAPDQPLESLPMLDESERRRVLFDWNDTAADYRRDATLHGLFTEWVVRDPSFTALIKDGIRVSYGELETRANRIAHRLIALGVSPDRTVGIGLSQGFDRVAALLGTLKAGGAYLPLDVTYPEERLRYMIADAGVTVLVTHTGTLTGGDLGVESVLDLALPNALDGVPDTVPPLLIDPLQAALVLYTSGTTGRPKGVVLSHRNVVARVTDHSKLPFQRGDCMSQISNFAFDAFTTEVWAPLTRGGTICLIGREETLDVQAFAATIAAAGINATISATALFNQFARAKPDLFAGFKYVFFGGEKADPAAIRAVLANGRPRYLLNAYGPAEVTTFSTGQMIETLAPSATSIPVGTVLANTVAVLLDDRLEPVPPGVAGEIFLGGAGLARGYLNRPALTAERFIPDPWGVSGEAGARLYRTGDLGRFRRVDAAAPDATAPDATAPDATAPGTIEFLARRDQQVKVRGFRIELGEIEANLAEHPAVGAAIVRPFQKALGATTSDHGTPGATLLGETSLAAYVIPKAGTTIELLDAVELRSWLEGRLPGHMVPVSIAVLDRFPMTPNRKVDFAALPAPEAPARTHDFVAPASGSERTIAEIWRTVLGVEKVGTHDNFFDLGGHSLAMARAHEQLRKAFPDADLPLVRLFEHTTVATLAAYLDDAADAGEAGEAGERVRERVSARRQAMQRRRGKQGG